MLTLSTRQPWAWSIAYGYKDLENRNWSTQVRGPILIHAPKTIDKEAEDFILHATGLDKLPEEAFITGGIVGSAEIIGCVSRSTSRWFFGHYGFLLQNQQPLEFFECKGQLGFFNVDYPHIITNCEKGQ